jgi:hypothetical protein
VTQPARQQIIEEVPRLPGPASTPPQEVTVQCGGKGDRRVYRSTLVQTNRRRERSPPDQDRREFKRLSISAYADLLAVREGRAVAYFVFFDALSPFDTYQEETLVSKVVTRAKSGV